MPKNGILIGTDVKKSNFANLTEPNRNQPKQFQISTKNVNFLMDAMYLGHCMVSTVYNELCLRVRDWVISLWE
jgi:hypothetical protein